MKGLEKESVTGVLSKEIPKMSHFETEQKKQDFLIRLFEAGDDWPLVAGGMGIDFSNPSEYITALIKAGVIPTMTASAVGLGDPKVYEALFGKNPMVGVAERTKFFREKNIEVLKKRIADARKKNPHGVIAMNLMAAVSDYSKMLETIGNFGEREKDEDGNEIPDGKIGAGGVDILCVGAGMPKGLGHEMNKYPHMKYMPIVSSISAAVSMIRKAKRKDEKGNVGRLPDGFYVEDPTKAAGHLGAKTVANASDEEFFDAAAVVAGIQELIKTQYPKDAKVPILLAGGINSKSKIDDAKEKGYSGAVIGTKALVTQESGLPNEILEEEYLNVLNKVVTTMESPAGLPSRGVEYAGKDITRTIEEIRAQCVACIGGEKACKHLQSGGKESYCIAKELGGVRHGRKGTHFAGTVLEKIRQESLYKRKRAHFLGTLLKKRLKDSQYRKTIPSIQEMVDLILATEKTPSIRKG